jgi:hypothetical protein
LFFMERRKLALLSREESVSMHFTAFILFCRVDHRQESTWRYFWLSLLRVGVLWYEKINVWEKRYFEKIYCHILIFLQRVWRN